MKKRKILSLLLALSLCMGLSARGANFADDPILGRNDDGGMVYTDKEGNVIIDASQYDRANEFRNGLARVCKGEKWGIINATGEVVVPCQYDHVIVLDNGTALLEDGDEKIYVDAAGQEIEKPALEDSHSTQIFQNPKGNSARNILEKYTGEGGDVVIPDYITEIGAFAFQGCTTVTSVTIPDSVTKIGRRAFDDCTALESVTIPGGIAEIESYMFEDCTALRDVTISNGLTRIGGYAFKDCTALEEIAIPDSVTEIGAGAFMNTGLKSVVIPDGVTQIVSGTFQECGELESVTIPDSVTQIGEYAFMKCRSLRSIVIPEGVTEIGFATFLNCADLADITLPSTLTKIGNQTFSGVSVTGIVLPDGVTEIGNEAFQSGSLAYIVIPESVTQIAPNAFGTLALFFPTIYGEVGSYAHQYAMNGNFVFVKGDPPEPEEIPDTPVGTAVPSYQRVTVDGKSVTFPMYALKDSSGNLTNYIRLRDLATALSGTGAQFNVSWRNIILLYPGVEYKSIGNEMRRIFSGEQEYYLTSKRNLIYDENVPVFVPADLDAILLKDEKSGGYTYNQLREVGQLLNFNVGWSADQGVFIETDKPYDPSN